MKTAWARRKASCGSLVWSYGFVSRAHAALHFRDPAGRPGPQDPQGRAKTLTCWAGFSSSPLLHHSKVVPGRCHSKRAVDVAHCAARICAPCWWCHCSSTRWCPQWKKTCGHSSPQFLEPQSEGFQETVNSTVLQERDWIPFGIFSSCFKVLCDLVASH